MIASTAPLRPGHRQKALAPLLLTLLTLAALLAGSSAAAMPAATVLSVGDGDTIRVHQATGRTYTTTILVGLIRLWMKLRER